MQARSSALNLFATLNYFEVLSYSASIDLMIYQTHSTVNSFMTEAVII